MIIQRKKMIHGGTLNTQHCSHRVWVLEHPRLAVYRALIPTRNAAMGDRENLVTASIHEAMQFETEMLCEKWITDHPFPLFVAREYVITHTGECSKK